MAEPPLTPDETSKVSEIRAKEAENAVNIKTQEEEAQKYKSEPAEKTTFKHYRRVFSYGTTWDLVFLVIGVFASIGAGAALPAMIVVFGKLIGNFQGFASGQNSAASFNDQVSTLALALVYIFIGKFTLAYIAMYTFRVIGIRISAAIRLAYLRALFSQSIGRLDKLPPGLAANTITTAANVLQIGISEKLSTCIMFTTLLIASYIIAFVYSWRLTLVASSLLVFCVVVYGSLLPFSIKFQKSFEHANEKATSIASEVFSSIRMVVACGAEKRVAESYSKWIDEARRRGFKLSPLLGIQIAPLFFAVYGDFAITFWYGVKLFREGHLNDVSSVIIVLFSVMMSVMSLGNIIAPLTAAGKAASAAATFFAMIDAPQIDKKGLDNVDVQKDICFKKVTFAYPSRPHVKVLDELDITFETGKLTAIVGPSGSGKSTIVGLLERWYQLSPEEAGAAEAETITGTKDESEKVKDLDDTSNSPSITPEGEISIGDHTLDSLDLMWWRSQIGLVQQEPFIFNDTIFKNVANGLVGSKFENESAEVKKKLVEEACKEAFADEFITRLPEGYDTKVGDSGIKLSGGQRQRLAIARSIIKRPMILIFDEATSSIDVRGERLVQEALDRVAKNRTTITIAHRLSTIRKADKIIVLSKGKAIEQGTHDELLQDQNGVYSGLVYAQQLTLGDSDDLDLKKALLQDPTTASFSDTDETIQQKEAETAPAYKNKGFVQTFSILMVEQKKHFIWFLLTIAGAMGAAAAYPLQAYLMTKLILVFGESDEKLQSDSQHWALMFTALACTTGASYFLVGWASSTLSTLVACCYRQEYFENATKKPISFFDSEENSSGTLTGRVSNDPTQIQEMLGLNMAFVLIAIFNMIGCTAISFAFGWKLTIVTFFGAVPIILVASFTRIRFEVQFEKMNALVFAESSQFAAEAIGASRTVAALTLEDMICGRFDKLLQGHVDTATKKARYTQLVFALSDSISLLCMALTFWYGARLMTSGEYSATQFFVIYTAMINGSEAAGQWCSFGPNMAQAGAAADRILSYRVREDVEVKPSLAKLLSDEDTSHGGAEITFQNVHFRYPTRDIPIFAGLNLTIKKGQFAGIVGASGGGKTTVISLLEQFYQPQKGKIMFDGVNIADIDLAEYRKLMSLVAQEPTLFQGTIKENILLAVDAGTVNEDDVHNACRDAEIHDFIMSLPDGYSTDIGSKGVALSGGQKQRIAIARALIRNPRILLLDEATSSLDSESEKLVQAAFERAGQGRTMAVVAHRLATVQNADVIFVLGKEGDGAQVLEKGTHNELVARKGIYYQMCKSQALDG